MIHDNHDNTCTICNECNEYVKIYVLKMDVHTLVRFLIFSDRTPLFYLIELNNN